MKARGLILLLLATNPGAAYGQAAIATGAPIDEQTLRLGEILATEYLSDGELRDQYRALVRRASSRSAAVALLNVFVEWFPGLDDLDGELVEAAGDLGYELSVPYRSHQVSWEGEPVALLVTDYVAEDAEIDGRWAAFASDGLPIDPDALDPDSTIILALSRSSEDPYVLGFDDTRSPNDRAGLIDNAYYTTALERIERELERDRDFEWAREALEDTPISDDRHKRFPTVDVCSDVSPAYCVQPCLEESSQRCPYQLLPSQDIGTSLAECRTPASDKDGDGLDDACEFDLARQFAPQLAMHPEEAIGERHTYWAVQPGDAVGEHIRVFYALGYRYDGGSLFRFTQHRGDSEFIILGLSHSRRGWAVVSAVLSAHFGEKWMFDRTQTLPRSRLTFDGHRPIVWVAKDKHANYASTRCGRFLGRIPHPDECAEDVTDLQVVEVKEDRNLGSGGPSDVDCVEMPNGATQAEECFWTGAAFNGWTLPGSSLKGSPGYASHRGGLYLYRFTDRRAR